MMHGGMAMKRSELVSAFRKAQTLSCSSRLGLSNDEQAGIAAEIAELFKIRQGCPTALGSGRASLRHKMAAVAHSCRLQLNRWIEVPTWLNSTFSWTGDLGVESGVMQFYDDLRGLLGDWIDPPAAPADGDDDGAEFAFAPEGLGARAEAAVGAGEEEHILDEAEIEEEERAAPAAQWHLDMRSSIYVPGLLHIIHNATEDLSSALPFWDEWLPHVRAVSRMLSKKEYADRLIETCFSMPPANAFADEIREFNHAIYEGRWGTLLAAVSHLSDLEDPLCYAWDMVRYSFGHAHLADDD